MIIPLLVPNKKSKEIHLEGSTCEDAYILGQLKEKLTANEVSHSSTFNGGSPVIMIPLGKVKIEDF